MTLIEIRANLERVSTALERIADALERAYPPTMIPVPSEPAGPENLGKLTPRDRYLKEQKRKAEEAGDGQ